MRAINLYYPSKLSVGVACINEFIDDVSGWDISRIFVLSIPELRPALEQFFEEIRQRGIKLSGDYSILTEPGNDDYYRVLEEARKHDPELVLGIGGGSVMDVAKLVAAQLHNSQSLEEITGINKLSGRNIMLVCMPSTSGTGSEASPNAILLDEKEQLKKGIISPHLVPDMCYVDPELSLSVPPSVTAATGIDAFTHCLEAYINKNAHPMIDAYALEGMRLISKSLEAAVRDGSNIQARSDLSLGSLYGGMCLGPVNTTAIHALSYPLGSEFHIAHGLSNALLLPYVMEYNLPSAPERYADVAEILGIRKTGSAGQIAERGIHAIKNLINSFGLPSTLSEINIPKEAISGMAASAMKIQRLLVNNPREVKLEDALKIYTNAYSK
ncbi:iron-containing alcohol dehydrogenase [Bacteroidota bacterium]